MSLVPQDSDSDPSGQDDSESDGLKLAGGVGRETVRVGSKRSTSREQSKALKKEQSRQRSIPQ